ncbi:MAG: heat-inducible transcription repressor HrcA [Clostridia bacterium]|nr:heat-inducible transcription repressor HrcA [Clostridia bacterium]
MKIDDRKYMILQAIIDDYIMTAVPVGSRTISRKSGVGFSPATIRNEMSDLEELGYLDQPHTSAGRIPSAKAYRLYVDQLMKHTELNEEDTRRIQEHLNKRTAQVEEVIRQAAMVLSDMTRYTAVVSGPTAKEITIKRLQLVPVTDSAALLIIVTSTGMLKEKLIPVPEGADADQLYGLSKLLTESMAGKSLSEAREQLGNFGTKLGQHRELMSSVIDVLDNQLDGDASTPLMVGGRSNLLSYPEYSDVEKARSFLAVLESREKLGTLLRGNGVEFTVRIGPEIDIPEFADCSVVTASYHIGKDTTGTMGIIGPTRMDYARVMSVLNYMGKAISDLLSGDRE